MKYCFSWRVRRTLAKFGLPFEKATPIVHCPNSIKRPRNNAGPAGIGLLIMKGIELLIRKGIGLLIMKFFLCRSSLGSTGMESCPLAELKYAIFRRAGRKTKNYRARSCFYR